MLTLANCKRCRGRPKKNWKETIREDLMFLELTEDMVQDRNSWRSRIRVVDYRYCDLVSSFGFGSVSAVSYTHLTLPTNREV